MLVETNNQVGLKIYNITNIMCSINMAKPSQGWRPKYIWLILIGLIKLALTVWACKAMNSLTILNNRSVKETLYIEDYVHSRLTLTT